MERQNHLTGSELEALAYNMDGNIRISEGDLSGALDCYHVAIELDPSNPTIMKNLSRATQELLINNRSI